MTEDDKTPTSEQPTSPLPPSQTPFRRLERTGDDRVLGGVSGGLGRYFNIDPVLFRILFAVLTLIGGAGALLYIALWIFVPADGSTGEMSGLTRFFMILVIGVVALFGGAFALAISAFAAATGSGWLIATVVIVIGLLLMIAALRGGARWLIAPALLLAIPLVFVSAFDLQFEGGAGERDYNPQTRAEIPADGYRLGIGHLGVDLRDVEWAPGSTTKLGLELGMGEVQVIVPPNVCVDADARMGGGYSWVLGDQTAGMDITHQVRSRPITERPRLDVEADIGMGRVQIVDDPRDLRRNGPSSGDWRGGHGGPEDSTFIGGNRCAEQGPKRA